MPTKKTKEEVESESTEASKPTPKPKRKVVRKPKKDAGPDLSSLPNNATPVQMDSVAALPVSADDLHNKQPTTVVTATQHEAMRDIKPREHRRAHPKAEADFLVPEKFNFDFNKNQKRSVGKKGISNKVVYTLAVLLLLLIGGLYYLTSYSTKMLGQSDNVAVNTPAQPGNGTPEAQAPVPASYSLSFSNVPTELKPLLTNALRDKFGASWGYTDYASTSLQPKVDTLFVKTSDQTENASLLTALNDLGIKPEIQQMADLSSSAVLYLMPTLDKPDLTGLTSTVANASGVSGLAKKYCGFLLADKVTACQAINATSTQTGTTVSYKEPKVFFTLKRTTDFAKAVFTPADSKQVEDIKVTIGK